MYFSEHKLQVEIDEKGHIDIKKMKKMKDKWKYKIILIVDFIGLVLMQRVLIFLLKLVQYKITWLNQLNSN